MSRATVLVIESEPWLGDHYERTLRKNNFHVMRAADPYTAMDMIDEKQPTAIVMNLLLSGASGLGLLHELQTYTDTAKIPVIVYDQAQQFAADDLQPYGVKRLLHLQTMQPGDVVAAIRSVLA